MLHKLEMPAYKTQLEAILDFQYRLLTFACTIPLPMLPLTPQILEDYFGKQIGGWLSKRCWKDEKGKNRNTFCKELEALIAHIADNPSEGSDITAAFSNDRDFYHHLDDPDFAFQYPLLSHNAKKVLAPLMVSFYGKLLETGFPGYIHLNGNELFTHKLLLKGFYEANPRLKVCPGCDGASPQISNKTLGVYITDDDDDDDYQDEAEVDHFFPKASYPFFSIHFMNLVPICSSCNTKAKRDKDPLNRCTDKGALLRTFVPFSKAAVQCIDVTISKKTRGTPKVVLKNRPGAASPEQVENLNRTFQLIPRWEYHLENWIREAMLEMGARSRGNRQRIEKDIKKKLRDLTKLQEDNIGQITHILVQRGYALYALSDQREIDLLIDQVMDTNAPRKRNYRPTK